MTWVLSVIACFGQLTVVPPKFSARAHGRGEAIIGLGRATASVAARPLTLHFDPKLRQPEKGSRLFVTYCIASIYQVTPGSFASPLTNRKSSHILSLH